VGIAHELDRVDPARMPLDFRPLLLPHRDRRCRGTQRLERSTQPPIPWGRGPCVAISPDQRYGLLSLARPPARVRSVGYGHRHLVGLRIVLWGSRERRFRGHLDRGKRFGVRSLQRFPGRIRGQGSHRYRAFGGLHVSSGCSLPRARSVTGPLQDEDLRSEGRSRSAPGQRRNGRESPGIEARSTPRDTDSQGGLPRSSRGGTLPRPVRALLHPSKGSEAIRRGCRRPAG